MIQIYHVSDLHFHHDNKDNQGALALLHRLQEKVKWGPSDSNYLLVTGDVTDDGDEQQYERAREALEPFKGHLIIAPGNHDYGRAGNLYNAACAHHFDEKFLPSLGVSNRFLGKEPAVTKLDDGSGTKVMLYGLNSVLETTQVKDFARGGIGESQLLRLHSAISSPESEGAIKLVYLHHRPQHCSWFLALVDSEDLMAVVHNRVHVLAFGHDGRTEESDEARMMKIISRPYGVNYLLNANSSVRDQRCYKIVCNGDKVTVEVLSVNLL